MPGGRFGSSRVLITIGLYVYQRRQSMSLTCFTALWTMSLTCVIPISFIFGASPNLGRISRHLIGLKIEYYFFPPIKFNCARNQDPIILVTRVKPGITFAKLIGIPFFFADIDLIGRLNICVLGYHIQNARNWSPQRSAPKMNESGISVHADANFLDTQKVIFLDLWVSKNGQSSATNIKLLKPNYCLYSVSVYSVSVIVCIVYIVLQCQCRG